MEKNKPLPQQNRIWIIIKRLLLFAFIAVIALIVMSYAVETYNYFYFNRMLENLEQEPLLQVNGASPDEVVQLLEKSEYRLRDCRLEPYINDPQRTYIRCETAYFVEYRNVSNPFTDFLGYLISWQKYIVRFSFTDDEFQEMSISIYYEATL